MIIHILNVVAFYLCGVFISLLGITLYSDNKPEVKLFHASIWFIWFPLYSGGILAALTHAYVHKFSFYYSAQQIFSNNKLLKYIDQALINIEDLD